jgi:phytoene/squalene synthetase
MLKTVEFYQEHLDRVSRSFAFCIRQLPDPLRGWVGLSYLTCRILDTIEDADWDSPAAQIQAFDKFDRALESESAASLGADLPAMMPSTVEQSEKLLMNDAEAIFQDIHALPSEIRQILLDLVGSMSKGMQHFCAGREGGVLRLKTMSEVNAYCFFVAGVVGELLAKLLAKFDSSFHWNQLNVLRAHHFGLFLQKVNLLKDQVGDEKAGRHLIPSRELVEASSEENARNAFAFLMELPPAQMEFRRFCAWSLFLGLESVLVARDSRAAGGVLKVARSRSEEIVTAVEDALENPEIMRSLFAEGMLKLGWSASGIPVPREAEVPEWLPRLYKGPLTPRNLSHLMT